MKSKCNRHRHATTRGLGKILRKKTFFLAIVSTLIAILSLLFLLSDINLHHKRLAEAAVLMSPRAFYADSADRFKRFTQSLRTEYERNSYTKKWAGPQEDSEFYLRIDRLGPINESDNSILVSGKIGASWTASSVAPMNLNPSVEQRFPTDILQDSTLNFVDPSSGSFSLEKLDSGSPKCSKNENNQFNCSGEVERESSYKFSGYFPLERNLERFPFDSARWSIELTLPRRAMTFRIKGSTIQFSFPDKPISSYLISRQTCPESDDVYASTAAYACWDNRVRYTGPPGNSKDWYVIPMESNIAWTAIVKTTGLLTKANGVAFFRYLFPLCVILIVLIITDILNIREDKSFQDVKLLAPPTIILALVFMQGSFHGSLPQISYLTYLDKLYYTAYMFSSIMLVIAVLESSKAASNRLGKFKRRPRALFSLRMLAAVILLICPLILWIA